VLPIDVDTIREWVVADCDYLCDCALTVINAFCAVPTNSCRSDSDRLVLVAECVCVFDVWAYKFLLNRVE
jgi:hypothetical protein